MSLLERLGARARNATKEAISKARERRTARQAKLKDLERKATPQAKLKAHERNPTPEAKLKALERDAAPDAKLKALERNAAPDAKLKALDRNAAPDAKLKARERNATPEAQLEALDRNAAPDANLKARERNATPGAKLKALDRNAYPRGQTESIVAELYSGSERYVEEAQRQRGCDAEIKDQEIRAGGGPVGGGFRRLPGRRSSASRRRGGYKPGGFRAVYGVGRGAADVPAAAVPDDYKWMPTCYGDLFGDGGVAEVVATREFLERLEPSTCDNCRSRRFAIGGPNLPKRDASLGDLPSARGKLRMAGARLAECSASAEYARDARLISHRPIICTRCDHFRN